MHIRFASAVLFTALAQSLVAQAPGSPATVIARIEGTGGDLAAELVNPRSPIRTDDGRFVLVSPDPLEVRVYTADGKLQRVIGRAGEGPGEYRSAVHLRAWPGDSVLVISSATRRNSLFGLDGKLVREWPAEPAEFSSARISVLGNVVFSLDRVNGARGCAAALIAASVPASAPLTEGLTDGFGRLWTRAVGSADWQIHTTGGRRVGSVRLPPRLVIQQFRGDTVIGVTTDADGFSDVLAIAIGIGTEGAVASADCANPKMPVTNLRSAMMRTYLRNLLTYGNQLQATDGRYPRENELPDGQRLEGTTYIVPVATTDSWVVILRDDETGYHCLMSQGPGGIPAASGNTMRCSSRIS